eukprot:PITA_29046
MFVGKQKLAALPLIPTIVSTPFLQWGLDFIGEIHPTSNNQHRWILTTTNYFTKWVEEIPVRNVIDSVVIKFIEENILSRFGCPTQIATDNARSFSNVKMIEFCHKYQILLRHSTPYHPQGLLQRDLLEISFQLVYGKDVIFPTNLAFPILKLLQDSTNEPNDFSRRINQIIELNENRDEVQYKLKKYQNKIKSLFDRRARERDFKQGDIVLRWDSRREDKRKHRKFDRLWFGPLAIAEVKGNNTFMLQNLEGPYSTYPVNGRKLYIQY